MPDMERRTILFVSAAGGATLRAAGSCALSAASMGDRVDVFLLGPALASLLEDPLDPEGPGALLRQARATGRCRLIGCSASLVESKADREAADQALDAVVGWPTILEWSRGVPDRFFF